MSAESASPAAGKSLRDRIELAMDRIRPAVQMDGGDVQLVDVDEASGVVKVAMTGACEGCSMSQMTLVFGIERTIRELVPEVTAVEAV